MTLEELTQRVSSLEAEVALLRTSEKARQNAGTHSWIDKINGSMKDFPEFAEVVRLGKEWRDAQREDDEQIAHAEVGAA
jgi:hypothetical protein